MYIYDIYICLEYIEYIYLTMHVCIRVKHMCVYMYMYPHASHNKRCVFPPFSSGTRYIMRLRIPSK